MTAIKKLHAAIISDLKSYQDMHNGYEWTYGFAIDSIRQLPYARQSAILENMKAKGLITDNGKPETFADGSVHSLWKAL